MSATAPASEQSITGAPHRPRQWTLEQEQLAREFKQHYGIEASQIGFETDRPDPIFDYDALSVLSLALTDEIVNMSTEPVGSNEVTGVVMMKCVVTLRDGRTREPIGTAALGEVMPGGGEIADFKQALDVAQARAVRKGLRAVGFDPVKAHQKRMRGEDLALNLPPDPHRQQMAEIHLLAQEAGLITENGDDSTYRTLMGQLFTDESGQPITTATKLNDKQRADFIANLRSLSAIKKRTLDQPSPSSQGPGAQGALGRNAETAVGTRA
jgi:hypothetical protein